MGKHRYGKCLRLVPYGEGFERWAKALGAQIQRVRESLDIARSELAAACNMWESTIARMELGKTSPSTRRLKQMADAMGVKVSDLIPSGE